MPSPLGHALGAFAAGWLVAGAPESDPLPLPVGQILRRPWQLPALGQAATFAALGMAPDLDLLVGRHSQATHSVGAALLVFGVAVWFLRGRRRWLVLATAAMAAYGSHILLDWLGQDATPPFGVMALWPFTHAYYISHLDIFSGISREPWRPGHAWYDLLSVLREVAIIGPVALASWWLRRPRTMRILRPARAIGGQELRGDRSLHERGRKSAAE